MKLKVFLLMLSIFVLSIFVNIFVIVQLRNSSANMERLEHNQNQMLGDSLNKIITLTRSEFRKQLKPLADSLAKLQGIKPKSITNITQIHNHYSDTTTNNFYAPMVGDSLFDISYTTDPCWGFRGTFNSRNAQTTLTEKWFDDEIIKFGYVQRDRLFDWRWTPRWGTKHLYISTKSKCNSQITTTEYTLQSPTQ